MNIPDGKYEALLVHGCLARSRNGTPSYKLTFRILGGPCHGERCWYDCWLTEKACPHSMRTLKQVGIVNACQLERPPVHFFRCVITIVNKPWQGRTFTRVRNFKVLGIEDGTPALPDMGEIEKYLTPSH